MAGGHFSRRLKRSHASVTAEAQPERRNRHEVGHYFRDKPVRDGDRLKQCCASSATRHRLPGALKQHYAAGPPLDCQRHYVSAYATAHPWEDFAETWAHLLHIVDTLEMARPTI